MKKMINTALVAVVATIAMVGTVNAKNLNKKASMQVSTTNLGQATKQALNEQSADTVLEALKTEPQTDAEQNTITLLAKEKELMTQEDLIKKELKNIRSQYSWIPFRTDAAIQKNYNDTKAELSKVQAELTNVRADLKVNMKETSRSWRQVAAYAVGAAFALGVTAASIYDLYYDKGYIKGGMAEVRAGMPKTRAAMRRGYESSKGYVTAAGNKLSQDYQATKRRLGYGAPVITELVIEQPVIEQPVAKKRFMQNARERM